MTDPMPVVFFGHGNPMNALARPSFTGRPGGMSASPFAPKTILFMDHRIVLRAAGRDFRSGFYLYRIEVVQ